MTGRTELVSVTPLEWGYSFYDSPAVHVCSEEIARAKASLDWSVTVWCRSQMQTTSGAWVERRTERPDGSVS